MNGVPSKEISALDKGAPFMNVPMSPILDVVHLTFLMLQRFGDKSVRTTPLLYFLRDATSFSCAAILSSRLWRKDAILLCSCSDGRLMGIAKKVSSLMLTLSCLARTSPRCYPNRDGKPRSPSPKPSQPPPDRREGRQPMRSRSPSYPERRAQDRASPPLP